MTTLVVALLVASGCAKQSHTRRPANHSTARSRGEARGAPANQRPSVAKASAVTVDPNDKKSNEVPTAAPPQVEGEAEDLRPPITELSDEAKRANVVPLLDNARKALAKQPPDAGVAIVEARRALYFDDKNVEAVVYLAWAHLYREHYDKTEYLLHRAEDLDGGESNAELYFLLGVLYQATDREEQGEIAYKRSLELNRNHKGALTNIGTYHLKNKRYDQAVEVYRRLTGPLGVDTAVAWTNLGSAYRGQTIDPSRSPSSKRELLLEAERAFRKAIEVNSAYANAHYNLALLYLDADQYPSGEGDLDTLERLSRAKMHFQDYAQKPGARLELAEEMIAVSQKLLDRESRRREKRRKRRERRERRRKERER